jgi:hypothetical protein
MLEFSLILDCHKFVGAGLIFKLQFYRFENLQGFSRPNVFRKNKYWGNCFKEMLDRDGFKIVCVGCCETGKKCYRIS